MKNRCALLAMLVFCAAVPAQAAGEPSDDTRSIHAIDPEALRNWTERAKRIMSSAERQDKETRHFEIAADGYDQPTVEALAGTLEGAYYSINQVLKLRPIDPDRKIKVYLVDKQVIPERHGFYAPPDMLALWKEGSSAQEWLSLLVHEATHAFLDQFIDPERRLPHWVNEGFATYLGESLIAHGQIEPGVFYTTHRYVFLNEIELKRPKSVERGKRLARKIKRGPIMSLAELIASDRAGFQSTDDAPQLYDLSWAFIHYLRHGIENGEKKLPRLIAALAHGSELVAAFESSYALQPEAMETDFHAHIRDRLANPPRPPRELLTGPN